MSQNPLTDRPPTACICVICIDDLQPADESEDFVICTPCFHVFHGNCLLRWIQDYPVVGPPEENVMRGTCPNCQSIITMEACNKIYLNSPETSVNPRAHDDERLRRCQQELVNAQVEMEKIKKENNTLKLMYNSARSKFVPNPVAVVSGTNVHLINVTPRPPNFAGPAVANRPQIENMRMRIMPQLSPAPVVLQRETGGTTVPPPRSRTYVLTFGNRNGPATSTSGSVPITFAHADQRVQATRNAE